MEDNEVLNLMHKEGLTYLQAKAKLKEKEDLEEYRLREEERRWAEYEDDLWFKDSLYNESKGE